MFGLGMSELVVLGVLALILIGPKQLPEVARTLGRLLNDLKRSAEGITDDIKQQAKVDLDLNIDKNFLEPRKKRDPDAPLTIMKDPRVQKNVEGKEEIKIQAPDQMTFTFDPHNQVDSHAATPSPVIDSEKTNPDDEKKE